jgi:hypothetical protein
MWQQMEPINMNDNNLRFNYFALYRTAQSKRPVDPEDNEKVACEHCVGYIRDCDYCGQKIEILEGKPVNYHEGSIHRCGRPSRRY